MARAAESRDGVDINALTSPGLHRGGHVNGNSARGWGKTNDANGHNDPNICWNEEGSCSPLGLHSMSAEEKEVGTPDSALLRTALLGSAIESVPLRVLLSLPPSPVSVSSLTMTISPLCSSFRQT